MYILLIIWFLFLFVYIIYNTYGIYRAFRMRIKGDIIPVAVLIYVLAMLAIIVATLIIVGTLDWGKNFKDLLNF